MRRLPHLIRRFWATLTARRLSPREQGEADGLLQPQEHSLFWAQPFFDQRHGLDGARRVLRARPGERKLARAALLHDVGKRHAELGVVGRSMASGLRLFGLPLRRWSPYYDHGPIGADELEAAGAETEVVAWARHHPDRKRPDAISPQDWALLKESDRA